MKTRANAAATDELADASGRLQLAVARLARLIRREVPETIGSSALATLATLVTRGPMRPGDLAAREGVRPPTMTRILTTLKEDGLAVSTVDPTDRRACLMQATEAGKALLAGVHATRSAQLAEHLARLDPAQREALLAALPALEALVRGGEA